MPIANYTTGIDADQSCAEIIAMLTRAGASSIGIDYENRTPVALKFTLRLDDRDLHYRLPSEPSGVLEAMNNDPDVPNHLCKIEQAFRVSWRILRDWMRAQMALVEANEKINLDQIMLPYLIMGPAGETMYQLHVMQRQGLLTEGR